MSCGKLHKHVSAMTKIVEGIAMLLLRARMRSGERPASGNADRHVVPAEPESGALQTQ